MFNWLSFVLRIKPKNYQNIRPGDKVRGKYVIPFSGEEVEYSATVVGVGDIEAVLWRDDNVSGTGLWLDDKFAHGWGINRKPDGSWGACDKLGSIIVLGRREDLS